MCTVVVRVEPGATWPVTLLALRDESPGRPWDPPAHWWPDHDADPIGIRDRRAGGAWLAASDRTTTLAVVLNRAEHVPPAAPGAGWTTRGTLPLDAVAAPALLSERPTTRSFNLLRADPAGVTVTAWDGIAVTTTTLAPGVHMVAEGAPDSADTPRIARWLPAFRRVAWPTTPPPEFAWSGEFAGSGGARTGGPDRLPRTDPLPVGDPLPVDGAWGPWADVLRASALLDPDDPEAVFRDADVDGHRMATLSVVAAAIGPGGVVLRHARLGAPGRLDERTPERTAR